MNCCSFGREHAAMRNATGASRIAMARATRALRCAICPSVARRNYTFFILLDKGDRHHRVLALEVHHTHALGGPANGANVARRRPENLALLRNDEQLFV